MRWPFTGNTGLTIDPAQRDPLAATLITALDSGDWRTTRDVFAEARHPDVRAFLMRVADEVSGVQDWIGEWAAAEPHSTLPDLVRGCHAVGWAWEARGGAVASRTSDEQRTLFHQRLRYAEQVLGTVLARDPDDVTAWTWLVISGRGTNIDAYEAGYRFEQVWRRWPVHLVAHEARLQHLCAKWHGSEREMFGFARAATAAAPPGSLLPALVPVAHVEHSLELTGRAEAEAYLARPEVVAEVLDAAGRSILHPAFQPLPGWTGRANAFAVVLSVAGAWEPAARVFDLIGDAPSRYPWNYFNKEPVRGFEDARRKAYAHR